jgi:hypothetical protein
LRVAIDGNAAAVQANVAQFRRGPGRGLFFMKLRRHKLIEAIMLATATQMSLIAAAARMPG